MVNRLQKNQCSGCGACAQRCPKNCISLVEDSEGFKYPHIDSSVCIKCGICDKVCPSLNPFQSRIPIKTYAAVNRSKQIQICSSSGGAFFSLAQHIIDLGGVVFGAIYDNTGNVIIQYAEDIDGCAKFMGSKYAQASIGSSFQDCERFLKSGRYVLFSGTPCQIAGLKRFLQTEYSSLLSVDFVCHGVPSPKVWRLYLEDIMPHGTLKFINMRDKQDGWENYHITIGFDGGNGEREISSYHRDDVFMKAFLENLILRPSCYKCRFKSLSSNSDITLGDWWGIQKVCPDAYDPNGTSLVIANNLKGEDFFKNTELFCKETEYADACTYNPSILSSYSPHFGRRRFFRKIDRCNSVVSLINESIAPFSFKRYIKLILNL